MSSKVISTILNLKDNFSKTINNVTGNTKKFQVQIKNAEMQAKKMRESVESSFSGVAAKAGALLGGIGLVEFAKNSLMLASDLNEVQNVVDTTFTNMSSKIDDFAKTTSSKFGISELQAKKYSGVLGAIMKSSGLAGDELANMSTSLAGLAGDMASFYNLDPEEAFEKIKSAIGGETEPMKALGVNMSVANMEAYALTQGITKQWKAMSQAEQTVLRYKYMIQSTKDAQGDYAKTSKGFANQLRTLQLNFQTLGAKIMSYSIPSFEKLFNKINDFVSSINIGEIMDQAIAKFNEVRTFVVHLGNTMSWTLPILAGVLSGFLGFMSITKVIGVVKELTKVISGVRTLLSPINLVALAIGLLVTGFITAYKNSSTFREKVDALLSKFQGLGDFLGRVLPPLLDQMNLFLIDKICPSMEKLGKFVEDLIQAATDLFNFIVNNWSAIGPIVEGIALDIALWKLALMGINTWSKIVTVTTAAWNTIELMIWGIKNATTAWEGAQWLLNVALDANPIGTTIVLIGLLSTAIYELVKHWQDICEWVQKACDWLNTWNGTQVVDKEVGITGNAQSADVVDADTPTFNPWGNNATGTQYWKGGLTMVGEHGPELVNLPSGSKVSTASQTNKALNSGGHTFNFYFNGNVGTEEFFDQAGEHIINKVNLALANM